MKLVSGFRFGKKLNLKSDIKDSPTVVGERSEMVRKLASMAIKAAVAVVLIAVSHRAGHASHLMQSAQPASGWRVFNRYQFSVFGAVRDTVMYVITFFRAIPESIRENMAAISEGIAEMAAEKERYS